MNILSRQILQSPRIVAITLLVPGFALLSGCVVEEPARLRRTVYLESLPPPRRDEVIVVETAPPPPREEVVIVQPSAAHIYIRGYWAWREGRYGWVAGRWELPPRPDCVWVEPRWERRERGYAFVGGNWQARPVAVRETIQASPSVNVTLNFVAKPPPPPRREVFIERERPTPSHIWIAGYWGWREGRHVWVAGRWEHPPRPGAVWIEPRWEHRERGYVLIEGFWR